MKNSVNRQEMIKVVSKEACITNKAAIKAINTIFDLLHDTVSAQKSFVIPGIGTVRGIKKPQRMGIDPRTGLPTVLPEKLAVKMKPYYKPKRVRKS